MARTPIQQQMYDDGVADATAGRPPQPPDGDGLSKPYLEGYRSAGPADDADAKPARPAKTAKPAKTSSKTSRRARTAGRRTARQASAPIRATGRRAIGVVGLMVGLAFLYNALQHPQQFGGFLGGAAKALAWLDDPTKSIPYKKG